MGALFAGLAIGLPRKRQIAFDVARAFRVSAALDYGIVGMNEGLISTAVAPFGGRKESGFGREGSKYGVSDYLDIKYTLMGGLG